MIFKGKFSDIKDISFRIGKIVGYLILKNDESYGLMVGNGDDNYDINGIILLNSNAEELSAEDRGYFSQNLDNFDFELNGKTSKKYLYIGKDNRYMSIDIYNMLIYGVTSISKDIGIVKLSSTITPILGYLLKHNSLCEDLYYEKFLNKDLGISANLVIDCAYSLGSLVLSKLINQHNLKNIKLINNDYKKGNLINYNSGSKFVIRNNKFPNNWNSYNRGCSINGDSTKCIFYYFDDNFKILDGEYVTVLFMKFFDSLNLDSKITCYYDSNFSKSLLEFVNRNGICFKSRSKILEDNSDILLYFTNDGIVRVVIKKIELLESKKLNIFSGINNSALSDGISNIFSVLYCLNDLNFGFKDWHNLLNRHNSVSYKFKVNKIGYYVVNEEELELVRPISLQKELDILKEDYKSYCVIKPTDKSMLSIYIESEKYLNIMKKKVTELLLKYENYLNSMYTILI